MSQVLCYPPVDDRVVSSGCYLTSIGSLQHPAGERYPGDDHPAHFTFRWDRGRRIPDTTLLYLSDGRGVWESRKERGNLRDTQFLFLPANAWHRYQPDPRTGWHEKWICLRGSLLRQYYLLELLPKEITRLGHKETQALEGRIDRLREEVLSNPATNRLSWGNRALSIILELWESASGDTLHVASPSNFSSRLQQALNFIQTNSHRPIEVGDIAAYCGCTRRTVERSFQEAGLPGVAREIARIRVERAAELLRKTHLSVKEIAAETGFPSANTLNAAFHRVVGKSPTAFREAFREDTPL